MICDFSKSFIVAFVFLSIFSYLDYAYAETDPIAVKMIVFENTSIVEFTNNGIESIPVFKFWLHEDYYFLSFKSEYGWTGEKDNQGTIIFSTDDALESGKKIKFGFKTNQSDIGITWNAISNDEQTLETNTTLSLTSNNITDKNIIATGFLPDSNFQVIPKAPHLSSNVRISGSDFEPNQDFHLFMNKLMVYPFKTLDDGSFIFTTSIPSTFGPGSIIYKIKDTYGNEIQLNGYLKRPVIEILEIPLLVDELSERYSIGNDILFTGKVTPNSEVSVKISDPSNLLWSEKNTISDNDGNWSLFFEIFLKSKLGTYTAKINALDYEVSKQLKVLLSNQIEITSLHPSYSKKDIISFNGIANPNEMIKTFVLNSNGDQVHSFEKLVPESGLVKLEYGYDLFVPNDTYFLYVFQGDTVEVLKFGIDEYPQKSLSSKMSKTNYLQDDLALIAIYGNPSELLDLKIVDDTGNTIFEDDITLDPNGKLAYNLDLTNLFTDYYSVIISKGTIKTIEDFTINFPLGFHSIDYNFSNLPYSTNDLISIYGTTDPKTPLTFTLSDPKSNLIQKLESFSNLDGSFSASNLKIPLNSIDGKWMLKIESGTNYENTFLDVESNDDFFIKVSEIKPTPYGLLVLLEGKNAAPDKKINISIFHGDSDQTWEVLTVATNNGDYSISWTIPDDLEGTFNITSKDGNSEYSRTFFLV